jgi:hypothetical protein
VRTSIRIVRIITRAAVVLVYVLAGSFALSGEALADGTPQLATATTQDLLDPVRGLSVIWHGKPVSALPFRIRLLNQASPLVYSLDIRRPARYGDSWTGISLGSPADSQARSQASIGIIDPLRAEAIARGDAPASKPIAPATSDEELAARQIAIWTLTNNIKLTPKTVPNAALRRRARQLLADTAGIQVPLQAASHSVQIFVQDSTANTVQLAITIGLDPNTHSTTPQSIDLYLDGVRCHVQTQALTHIKRRSDGTYYSQKPTPEPQTSTDVAEVDLARNTQVVDATANWVNVTSDPGLVMAGADAAPPIVTAEPAVLNFTTTTQLDPSQYTNPEQLLNNQGTAFLTTLSGYEVWVVLLLALYFLPRVGRLIDKTAITAWHARQNRRQVPPAAVNPTMVEVEATTANEAIRAGLLALNLTTPDDVIIEILHTPGTSPSGTHIPARVRLARRP